MSATHRGYLIAIVLLVSAVVASSQEVKTYAKSGVTFEYAKEWELTERADKDTTQIGLSNAAADSQIAIIVVTKEINSKEPLTDAKKQVIDPWIASLIERYTTIAQVKIARSEIKTEVGGQPTDGVKLTFTLDGQEGQVETCWALLGKRLVLLYIVRPDKKADIVTPGWNLIRQTIRITTKRL